MFSLYGCGDLKDTSDSPLLLRFRNLQKECYTNIDSFIRDKFSKMQRLISLIAKLENDCDCAYVILRLIQKRGSGYLREMLQSVSGYEFEDIGNITLKESAYLYYSKCSKNLKNIGEDPALMYFTHFLIFHNKFSVNQDFECINFLRRREEIKQILINNEQEFEYKVFEEKMKKERTKIKYSILDVDKMDGFEFEDFIAGLFSRLGYRTEVTKHTGDYGVDVIAEKNETKIAIQAKCYVGPVTPDAVQEITAGKNYYNCQRGIVVTNSYFSKAATKLAISNCIELWDRKVLEEKICEVF